MSDGQVGDRYGRWIVVAEAPKADGSFNRRVQVRCDCGTLRVVRLSHLKSGASTSCGCAAKEKNTKHGLRPRGIRRAEYDAWVAMNQRCENPNNPRWKDYGGRGITVCAEWRESFEIFMRDMGLRPSPNHSIDRIDNDRGYEPANCRWATRSEQQRNQRRQRSRKDTA